MEIVVLILLIVALVLGAQVFKYQKELRFYKMKTAQLKQEMVNETQSANSLNTVPEDNSKDNLIWERPTYLYEKVTPSEIQVIFDSMLASSKTISFFALDNQFKYMVFNQNHEDYLKELGIYIRPGEQLESVLRQLKENGFNAEVAERLTNGIYQAFAGERVIYEEKLEYDDGQVAYQCLELVPLISKQNVQIGAAVTIRDITKEQMRQHMLEQATLEEKKANQAKTNFLANMSHEIRTPMNGILGLTDLLLESELNEEQHYFLTMIRKSGLSLLNIINDILDFSKIESGNFSIMESDVNFYNLVDEVKEFFRFKSDVTHIDFNCVIDPNVPVWLVLDSLRIRQILINLIGNAFKFTSEGYVKVIVRMLQKEDGKEYLKVSVEDSGVGISYNRLSSIFDRFKQAEDDYNRGYEGTGLGLSISKQLISAMDGTIDVISKKDVGSIFYFEIPLKRGRKIQTDAFEKQLKVSFTKDIHILVVEDNQVNCLLATSLMNKIGVTSSIARNGLEAVKLVKENNYDMVFMDISMPIMDGLEAFKIIRQDLKKTMPIVALTAHSMVEDRQRILTAGMTDYLSKPFSETDISTMIERYVINPAKVIERVNQLQSNVDNLKKTELTPYNEPISPEVLNTPLHQMNNDSKKSVDNRKEWIYNEFDMATVTHFIEGAELMNEALDGILYVDTMLEGDHKTTVELVGKLIELINDPILEQLRKEMIAGNRNGVSEVVHHIKGAVANFKLKRLLDELNKIKTLDWTDIHQVDYVLDTLRAQRRVLNCAYEKFKENKNVG